MAFPSFFLARKMMVGRYNTPHVCLLQLITYGDTREDPEEALTTMTKALDNYCIKGNWSVCVNVGPCMPFSWPSQASCFLLLPYGNITSLLCKPLSLSSLLLPPPRCQPQHPSVEGHHHPAQVHIRRHQHKLHQRGLPQRVQRSVGGATAGSVHP